MRKQITYLPKDPQFAYRLNLLMKENGDTASSLQSLLGVSRSTISHYLQGSDTPQMKNIILLAKHYKVTTDWLLGMPGSVRSHSQDINTIASTYLLSEKSSEFLKGDGEDEYCTIQRRKALDFLTSSKYSGKFFDAIASGIEYLEEAMSSSKSTVLNDFDTTFFYFYLSDREIDDDIKSVNKKLKDKYHEDFIVRFANNRMECEHCFTIAQNALNDMYKDVLQKGILDKEKEEAFQNKKNMSKKKIKKEATDTDENK